MVDGVTPDRLLEAPNPSAGYPAGIVKEIAEIMDDTRKSLERFKRVAVNNPLKEVRDTIDKLSQEELAALEQVAKAKENQNLWNYGHVISSSLYASALVLFGAFLFAQGEKKGVSFITSGTALLVNTLLSYHGGWKNFARLVSFGNSNIENTLSVMLPIAATLLTSILTSNNLSAVPLEHKDKIEGLQTLMSWVNMFVQIGNSYTSWKRGQAERQKIYIEARIKAESMKIEPINIRNESLTEISKRINDAIKQGIKTIFKGTAALPVEG